MKKIKILLLSLFVLLTSKAYANSVFISNWQTGFNTFSCFRISNISDVQGEVNVTFYTSNGTVHPGPLHDPYLISALGTPFVVPPKHTARFCLTSTTTKIGYGRIDTSAVNIGDGKINFIAHGNFITPNSNGYAIQINNGLPF